MNLLQRFTMKKLQIEQIFNKGFEHWKYFTIRMEYSLSDYRIGRISKTNHSIKRGIYISIIGWAMIISFTIDIYYPENPFFINMKLFDQMLGSQRNDLLAIELIIISIIMELTWLYLINNVLQYRCSITNFIAFKKWSSFISKRLDKRVRQNLIRFYIITDFLSVTFYYTLIIALIIVDILFTYCSIIFYSHNQITILKLVISVPAIVIITAYICYLLGQLFYSLNFIIFIIEFFKIWLQQLSPFYYHYYLVEKSKNFADKTKILKFRNQFHYEYVQLYAEIRHFNHTASKIFLCIEFISKSAIIMSCIYYSFQWQMDFHNTMVIGAMLAIFLYTTGIYFRIARLPAINHLYIKSISNWLARLQYYRKNDGKKLNNISERIIWYQMIKSNLFIQTMANNRLGFHCGHLFFITRYKCIELFLLNFSVIMMFYKKIIRFFH